MMENATNWFSGLTLREKILIGIAGTITAMVVFIYVITLPLLGAVIEQRSDYREALERRASIEAKVERLTARKPSSAKKPAASLKEAIDLSAGEAGFTLDRIEARGEDIVDVAIAQARPAALMQWLAILRDRGINAGNIEIAKVQGGSLSFSATFRMAGASK